MKKTFDGNIINSDLRGIIKLKGRQFGRPTEVNLWSTYSYLELSAQQFGRPNFSFQ